MKRGIWKEKGKVGIKEKAERDGVSWAGRQENPN